MTPDDDQTTIPASRGLLLLALGIAYGIVLGRQYRRPADHDDCARRYQVEILEEEVRRIATVQDAHDRYAHHQERNR